MWTRRTTRFAGFFSFAVLSSWAMFIPIRSLSASAKATLLKITSKKEAGFTRVEAPGIRFANLCPASRSITNQIYLNGSGLAAGDVDGDGWCDLFFAGLENQSALYRNLGNWRFKDITQEAGLTNVVRDATGVALVDIDGDGDLDLIVNSVGNGTWIYLNDGRGHFTPVSWTSGAFLDEYGKPLQLPPFDWGLSVMMRDLNGDGRPDVYVCNDFKSPDRIWINQGHGQFKAAPRAAFRHTSLASMAVDAADINRDGFYDILVVDMLSREHRRRLSQILDLKPEASGSGDVFARPQYSQNTLFLSRGDGTYAETAWFSGLAASEWSWTPVFLDVDFDGYEDLLVSTGFERDNMQADVLAEIERQKSARSLTTTELLNLRKLFPRLATPNLAFRNLKNGKFEEVSREWGFDQKGVSQGMILADLDNDGDMDVVCNNFNEGPLLFRNEAAAPRIAVSLKGLAPNTEGIGAEIRLFGPGPVQRQEMIAGARYLSSDQPLRSFAAPGRSLAMEIKWPSGRLSHL